MRSAVGYLVKFLCVLSAVAIHAMSVPAKASDHQGDTPAGPAGPVGRVQGPDNKGLWWIPCESSGDRVFLESMVYTPSGTGPFPLAIISHGKPTPGSDTRSIQP